MSADPVSTLLHSDQALPISVTMKEATRLSGIGRTSLYELISRGEIRAKKAGRVTLILVNSLKAHIERLPDLPSSR